MIGAIAGYLTLWSIYWLFKLIRGKEGMGYGDFKLLAALGAWLGWKMLPLIVLRSSVVGAFIGISAHRLQGSRPQRAARVRAVPRDRRGDRAVLRASRSSRSISRLIVPYVVGLTGGIGSGKSEVDAGVRGAAASESPTPTPSRTR